MCQSERILVYPYDFSQNDVSQIFYHLKDIWGIEQIRMGIGSFISLDNINKMHFDKYEYRIKPSEPVYVYPIYKRLKKRPEMIIKFTSINAGIYISTHKNSIYKKYEKATALTPHTEEDWEDCDASINENTIELFEVIYYCDILKEFEFVKQLYLDEDLINKRHLQKTGRSFIIDKETRQIIKVVNK